MAIIGLSQLRKALATYAAQRGPRIAAAAVTGGLPVMLAGARRRVARRSGDLLRHIRPTPVKTTRSGAGGGIVADSHHAAANELGTTEQAAHPFLRPMAHEDRPAILAAATAAAAREASR